MTLLLLVTPGSGSNLTLTASDSAPLADSEADGYSLASSDSLSLVDGGAVFQVGLAEADAAPLADSETDGAALAASDAASVSDSAVLDENAVLADVTAVTDNTVFNETIAFGDTAALADAATTVIGLTLTIQVDESVGLSDSAINVVEAQTQGGGSTIRPRRTSPKPLMPSSLYELDLSDRVRVADRLADLWVDDSLTVAREEEELLLLALA